MSYYYIVNALSHIGDSLDNVNEGFFADNISSFSKGICENSEMVFKSVGKKHIFCVVDSSDKSGKIFGLLKNLLSGKSQGKVRVKFQYDLKEMMDNIFSGEETRGASLLYLEGKNVFAAGYGEVFVYKYSKALGKAERILFPVADDALLQEEEETSRSLSRFVGTLSSGDEYFVVGKQAQGLLGDEKIAEIFESTRMDLCQSVRSLIFENNPSESYCMIHIKAKKSIKWILLGILSGVVALSLILPLIF